ncbi:MAG: DUF58 domain-containing protein [Thiomonas sp.]
MLPDLLHRHAATRPGARPLLRAEDAAALIALARGARGAQPAQLVGQRAAGDAAAVWRGRGLDYLESRAYQPGDDLRDLHWRLLARTGRPFVKLHHEEHAPAWHALLDLRAHMGFGTRLRTKAEQAARMTLLAGAVHALAAEGAAGTMALTLWRSPVQTVDLGRGLSAVRRLAQMLQQEAVAPPAAQEDEAAQEPAAALAVWAQRLRRVLPEGSRVVCVTDGALWDASEIDAALWALRSRAEVVMLLVQDPVERALPGVAAIDRARFVDLAQRQGGVLPDAAAARAAFAAQATQRRAALLSRWRSRGLTCIDAGVGRGDAEVLRALRGR